MPDSDISEAEVRFGVINPIVGAIAQCTNTLLASEESISTNEAQSSEQPRNVVGGTSHTPSQQKSISKDIRPDYVIYTLTSRTTGLAQIAIIEVKHKKDFNNDRSICQTIGYYIASSYSLLVDNQLAPPLLVLICEEDLRFIFLPFIKDGSPCIDAIVTPAIPIAEEDTVIINHSWFAFICYYIKGALESELKLIRYDPSIGFYFHDKKSYQDYMEILDERRRCDVLEEQLKQSEEKISEMEKRIRELEREKEEEKITQLTLTHARS